MDGWGPRSAIGPHPIRYAKFKLGRWARVSSFPDWVNNAHEGYYEGFIEEYGHRPYNVEKVYTGDNLQYKIRYEPGGRQGEVSTTTFARVKR